MTFNQVLTGMKSGTKYRRPSWQTGVNINYSNTATFIMRSIPISTVRVPYIFKADDLYATDWEAAT